MCIDRRLHRKPDSLVQATNVTETIRVSVIGPNEVRDSLAFSQTPSETQNELIPW